METETLSLLQHYTKVKEDEQGKSKEEEQPSE
jgi:hypothetical protein